MKLSRATHLLTICALGLFVACGSPSEAPQSPQSPQQAPASTPNADTQSASANADSPAPSASPASTPKPDAQNATAATAPAQTAPTVRVLDPGKAPRRALRYAFKVGAPEWLEMDMKVTVDMAMDEKPSAHVTMPTMRMLIKSEAKEKTANANGSVTRVAFEVERADILNDVQVPSEMREQLTKQFAGIVGLRGRATISARGVASDVDFEPGSNASESLSQMLENMRDSIRKIYAPLPEEDVGVGARWVVTTQLPVAGATWQNTTNYELTELSTNAVSANVNIEMLAPPNQPIDGKRLPPGTTATLDSMSGKGQGKVTIALTRLVGGATIQTATDMAMTVHTQNGDNHVTTHNVIDFVSRPAKGPSKGPSAKARTTK